MTRQRFFLPPAAFDGATVRFPEEQSRQIRQVLRLRPGDEVLALDGSGDEYALRLVEVGKTAIAAVRERRTNRAEPRVHIALYQAVLKGAKMELILQKGTEVGVSAFVPVMTARCVPADSGSTKQRRYEAIVREAAEQSGRGRLPRVEAPRTFRDAIGTAQGTIVMPFEGEGIKPLSEVDTSTAVSLFIGPEGGFSEEEIALAREAGAEVVTLGPRILRAETAAIVASALVLARAGEMG